MNYKKDVKEFELKRGLDSLVATKTGKSISVNDDVTITLVNNETLHGILTYVGVSSVIIRTSDYEYSETGASYQQALILIKDIKDIFTSGKSDDEIDWRMYSEAINVGY
jgi:hypothetical protein